MQETARISIIAAIGKNNELGKNGDLIWKISADLQRVKKLTTGHPIIMGRKTYDSIGRPLPNRINIVISRNVSEIVGCLVYDSLEKAIAAAHEKDQEEIFIFGGSHVYTEALPITDRLYLTIIDETDSEADTFFPDYSMFTKTLTSEPGKQGDLSYSMDTLER